MKTRTKMIAGGIGLLVVVSVAVPSEDKATPKANAKTKVAAKAAATTSPTPEPTPAPKPPVSVKVTSSRTVYQDAYIVKGLATRGSTVKVNSHKVKLHGRKFSKPVKLHHGQNSVSVRVRKRGMISADRTVHVSRKFSRAEKDARAAARAAAKIQAVTDYKNGAQSIDYDQLHKNADNYSGTKVKFTGQIMQIQESYGGGMMLLSVTDEGYGFWTDNVWVDYDESIQSAEDDVITVYGEITGSKSYETQIGGETYVPQMRAKYIEE